MHNSLFYSNITSYPCHIQSAIKATQSKGKKDKKKGKKGGEGAAVSFGNGEADEENEGETKDAKEPVEMTPDDLADEEWGPAKAKGKKGKKGKAGKGKVQALLEKLL